MVPLTVAGFYTKQDKYMRRVALLFRTFFCDPGDATLLILSFLAGRAVLLTPMAPCCRHRHVPDDAVR